MEVDTDLRERAAAQRVLSSLADWEPGAVRALAVAVGLAERPLCEFSQPLDYLADVLEHPELTGDLANLRMRRSLRLMARHPRLPELLERLEGADGAPWGQLRAALGG
jgi:hypothetical protein